MPGPTSLLGSGHVAGCSASTAAARRRPFGVAAPPPAAITVCLNKLTPAHHAAYTPARQHTTTSRRLVRVAYRETSKETEIPRTGDKDDAQLDEAGLLSLRRHFGELEPPNEGNGPQAIIQRAKAMFRPLPIGLADIGIPSLGVLAALVFAGGMHNPQTVGYGLAAGAGARVLQQALLEQTVPFTLRRHTLLLPVGAELAFGAQSYAQVLQSPQYRGKILPSNHQDVQLVERVAKRIIAAVEQGHGGGFQKHIADFDWEVAVVEDETPNAFVLPGGKIVVFTGILKVLQRNEDMLATILGHEAAHALARHSAEKLTLGLAITAGLQLLSVLLFRGGGGGGGGPGGRFPGQGGPYGQRYPGNYPGGYGGRYPPSGGGRYPPYGGSRGPRGLRFYEPTSQGESALPGVGGILRDPRIINTAAQLLLQLPFSRRAEAEADLIGLKLMALAGYNPRIAPKTFLLIEEYQSKGGSSEQARPVRLSPEKKRARDEEQRKVEVYKKQSGGRVPSTVVQTHPRSARRAKMLEEELDKMVAAGPQGAEVVLTEVPYWML